MVTGDGGTKAGRRKRKKGKAKTQNQGKEENINAAVVKTEEKKDPPKTANWLLLQVFESLASSKGLQ